jgi:hypothetical protein
MPLSNNHYHLCGSIADVGTAATVVWVVPTAGYLRRVSTVLNAAITGANDTITMTVDGTTLAPTITITQSGSAAGDYDYADYWIPVKEGSRITAANSGASTGTAALAYTLTLSA